MRPTSLNIDGENVGTKHIIYADNIRLLLTRVPLRFLAIMGAALIGGDNDGWVFKDDLYLPERLVRQNIYQLKNELHESPELVDWPVIENDRAGNYRLDMSRDGIRLNASRLRELGYTDLNRVLDCIAARKSTHHG